MCKYCKVNDGDANNWFYKTKYDCFVDVNYWGKGRLDISGGVTTPSDVLHVVKELHIKFCPMCGKEIQK